MTARDARGRFQNADVAAAERVLEAAVWEAVAILRRHPRMVLLGPNGGEVVPDIAHARQVLLHAAHAVEPLLRSAS